LQSDIAITGKSVFSFLHQLTTWHCCGAAAADRRPAGRAAIDRYLLASWPTAANPQQRRAAAGWDRRTDSRTIESSKDHHHYHQFIWLKFKKLHKLNMKLNSKGPL